MPELSPDIAEAVFAACKAGAQEASEALSRALDCQMAVEVETPDPVTLARLPGELNGPGLVVVLHVDTQAALLLLPESSGLVPSWCAAPDATGQSKLSTLGQELGMLLLPEACPADRFEWACVANLADAIRASGVADGAAMIAMPAAADDGRRGVARLVWPAPKPDDIARTPTAPIETPADVSEGRQANGNKPDRGTSLSDLPVYSRSLLHVKVPVVVTLAKKRQPVCRIVELGPGCIIQFDKSCEDMLDLNLGGRMIANGEAVKVGDKFGLRITNIVLPEERFFPLKKA